ncbi:hypothetical protein [Reichenbachiella ulvae]|uniref:Uncharacterized protein n=1 Tax=Reichenbachiella ulvae TaxID=2980104 RepID=A0ABT3CV63_9BACT|nr:hypothetical protein [Reichenbachiella ulvae]MCV9387443.1 hypothetical protein [Reichenbachiella ulvae]
MNNIRIVFFITLISMLVSQFVLAQQTTNLSITKTYPRIELINSSINKYGWSAIEFKSPNTSSDTYYRFFSERTADGDGVGSLNYRFRKFKEGYWYDFIVIGDDSNTLYLNGLKSNGSEPFGNVVIKYGNLSIGSNPGDANLTIGGGALTTYNLKIQDKLGRAVELISPTEGSPYGRLKISSTISHLRLGVRDYPDALHLSGHSGYVGIGTTTPDELLTVNGTIHSSEVRVDLDVPAPDYVFSPDYQLSTLEETAAYIEENHHLPEIPSAAEMEANGVELGEMNMLLLKKIEELTLHLIEKEEQMNEMQKEIDLLKEKVK